MIRKKSWLILVTVAVLLKLFSFFPAVVEHYYSTGVYPYLAEALRLAFGWVPFSVGDLFYAGTAIYLIYKLGTLLKKLFARQITRPYLGHLIKKALFLALVVYVVFNVCWGLNYNRLGIAHQLRLEVKPYTTPELTSVVRVIVGRLNALDTASRLCRDSLASKEFLFSNALAAYQNLGQKFPFFGYAFASIKPSVFSYAGDYLGFTGYYDPFSGEAQVNTTVPVFVQPFTTCHEIGHQLGYAKEEEANFAGYLSAKASDNPAFRYSVYFDLYLYAAKELYLRDSTQLVPLRESLHPDIRRDFRDLRSFYRKYENPLGPLITRLYGNYLRANQQPQGIMAYNEVIAWLIAYQKKFGNEAV